MEWLERAGLLLVMMRRLREHESWCGETHIQKAAYFLQELLRVPLEYRFVLYKHGPFSFELRDELAGMQAEGFLVVQPMGYPYGPSLREGPAAEVVLKRYGKQAKAYRKQIEFVAAKLGDKRVVDLEKLATALYVTLEGRATGQERAGRIHALKTHIPIEGAQTALAEIDRMREEAEPVAC
jgi:uncharacterized protein YwgA